MQNTDESAGGDQARVADQLINICTEMTGRMAGEVLMTRIVAEGMGFKVTFRDVPRESRFHPRPMD